MTLLEDCLPRYEVNEIHAIEIRAAPERVYETLAAYRLGASPLFRVLFGLRKLAGLPLLLVRGRPVVREWSLEEPPLLALKPFVKVAEAPNKEIVLGLIGKFWQPAPQQVMLADGEAFLRFDDPTYGKAAMNFRLTANGAGLTRLSTETRVHTPEAGSRRLFRLYWLAIGFFSGLIRVDMLKRIKRLAERNGA